MEIGKQLELFDNDVTIPTMPEEMRGKEKGSCRYTKSMPREWTDEEIKWLSDMKAQGFNNEQIAQSMGRTAISIAIKLKRIGKRDESYNEHHRAEKYICNKEFFDTIHPTTILDLFCGTKSYWGGQTSAKVTTNDKDASICADYHEKAEMLIHKLYYEGNKYDIVDLDPYGSAYDCFDLAVKMAQKGLIVTFGELGHKRFKRLDFVRRYYGINTLEDFTLQNLVQHLQMIAERNKKRLTPIIVKTWDRIGRVWFKIEPITITEQWEQ